MTTPAQLAVEEIRRLREQREALREAVIVGWRFLATYAPGRVPIDQETVTRVRAEYEQKLAAAQACGALELLEEGDPR